MRINNHTTTHFTPERVEYQLVLPINFGVLIPGNDSVRLLSQIVEELDLRDLMLAYSPPREKSGGPAKNHAQNTHLRVYERRLQ